MRKQLITVLKNGESLNLTAAADHTIHYNFMIIMGSSDDAVKFTLNGTQIVLPGGTQLSVSPETLTVDAIYGGSAVSTTDLGIVLFGFDQSNTMRFL